MSNNLMNRIISSGIHQDYLHFTLHYKMKSLFGGEFTDDFRLLENKDNTYVFQRINDCSLMEVDFDKKDVEVLAIDGMNIKRFSRIYGLNK